MSLRAPFGTQRVTMPRLAASSAEGVWSKMDARAFRPGVVQVCPQRSSQLSGLLFGPIDLCIRHLRLAGGQTLTPSGTGGVISHILSLSPLLLEAGRLATYPLALALSVYPSVEINPLLSQQQVYLGSL